MNFLEGDSFGALTGIPVYIDEGLGGRVVFHGYEQPGFHPECDGKQFPHLDCSSKALELIKARGWV